jgi:rRNA small subunit pseudouridine methyltransferase Nep1
LIIAEAALETVPKNISRHASVTRHATRKGKAGTEILLDRSYHHKAMLMLDNADRRGRPDLVHFALLEAVSTPLYRMGLLRIYVHSIADKVIFLHEKVRLPKSYFRFEGLMEELIKEGQIRSDSDLLMEIKNMRFADLLSEIKPSKVIGLSRRGIKSDATKIATMAKEDAVLVVGGFPRGHFSARVAAGMHQIYSISDYSLEAHVVIARVLYECEKLVK